MVVKDIVFEDFINYKKPSMFIICPKCSFKCNVEAGRDICQNSKIASQPDIEVSNKYIVENYVRNDITKAVVFGGLEPFDTFYEMVELIHELRKVTDDDIVIYTGYNKDEIVGQLAMLSTYKNIVVKFGRFIPDNAKTHIDEVLGVELCSENQYAERIDLYDKVKS